MNSTTLSSMPDEALSPSAPRRRFQWLDTLRGAALIAMASYHFMWDLAAFEYLAPDFPAVGWPKIYARAIASTFLFLAGFSLVLAHGNGVNWAKFWKRFAMVAGAAALISALTFAGSLVFSIPQALIYFGILHEIALASIVGLLFLRAPWPITAVAGVAVVTIANSLYLRQSLHYDVFDTAWFWWSGLGARSRSSFDLVPVFPWLGAFLLGIALARSGIIQRWLRQNDRGITSRKPAMAPLAFLGRHSLVFYLVHQPVLISILYVFSLIVPAPQVPPEVKYIESCEMSCKPDRDANFCHQFCGCTLKRLQQLSLLAPFQSGAISVDDDERIKDIAVECTALSR